MWLNTAPLLATLDGLAAKFYTVQQRIETIEKESPELRPATKLVERDISEIKERVARLEEGRLTLKSETQSEIIKTVADLKVAYAQLTSDLKVQIAQSHKLID